MKKIYTSIFLSVCLLVLIFPVNCYGDLNVNALEFNDIESNMMAYNLDISSNHDSYENAVNAENAGIKAIDQLITSLENAYAAFGDGDEENDNYEAALKRLIKSQLISLNSQKASLGSQDRTDVRTNIIKADNTIIWNMELLYITYNNNNQQLKDYLQKKALAEGKVQITKKQKELGMATDLKVSEAQKDLATLQVAVDTLENANKTIVKQFNIALDQDVNTALVLKEVPEITDDQVNSINLQDDYFTAESNSYDILLSDDSIDAERKFQSSFYNLYQSVLDKKKNLELERNKLNMADFNYKTADLKYKLGMLSTSQYNLEKSAFISQQSTTQIAKNTLTQAYRQYEWAKRGMIFSSGLSQ